jgi:hypothetical protein
MERDPARRRRRAVGPTGAAHGDVPRLGLEPEPAQDRAETDRTAADRYRREQPPHHDKGV